MPRKVFVAGEILTAADVNTNLMDQSVMVFDDATDRTTAIPTPVEGMVTYLKDTNAVESFNGSAFVGAVNTATILNGNVTRAKLAGGLAAFTASTTITASNSSFSVPALGSPIVKVTVIGGGGGGGDRSSGGAGATTTFNAGGGGSVSAGGGSAGKAQNTPPANVATVGFASGNFGASGNRDSNNRSAGGGGRITVGYLNLNGVSTVNVTIGGGGGGGDGIGANGGRGEVILEFVAA